MKKGTVKLLLISIFSLILLIIIVKSYSSLSTVNEEVINKESDINVQLNRKNQQVSGIATIYKNYINEEEIFDNLEKANNKLKTSVDESLKDREKANKELSNQLNQLFEKTSEEMKKDEEIVNAINELLKTEKRLDTAKNNYNEAVENYNSKVNGFPSSIVASIRGFKTKDKFESSKIINILENEE